ncbi:MAG: alpha-galactosidase [Chloroflexi bacterium]|nr:alpha-galactosidase [Chloroflexota bacterium]
MTRFRLHADGAFDVLDGRRVVFANAFARVTYRDAAGQIQSVRTKAARDARTLTGSDACVTLTLCFDDALKLGVTNTSTAPIFLDTLDVFDCDAAQRGEIHLDAAAKLRYLHHGWQSWSPTAVRQMTEPETVYSGDDYSEKHLPYGAPDAAERTSNGFMLIGNVTDENALLLGFESGARQFGQIRCTVNERVTRVRAVAYGDGVRLAGGAAFDAEPFGVRFGDANALYEQYAQRVAQNMGRRGAHSSLQGWCSWYYFYGANSADDIRANVSAMRAANLPLDVVLIDDGYATAIGDWTSIQADKFPAGMRVIADEIRAAGKSPGIWLAPFGAQHDSQLVAAHPEFVLRDAQGAPVYAWDHLGEKIFALDLTHPGVQQWLRDLFHTVCDEWGYAVVKLDFLFAGALAGKHLDDTQTRAQIYRRGLQIVAETVGAARAILGCGAPQSASVGLVDAMRVSQDVHFAWEALDPANAGSVSTRHAVQNTLLRAPFDQTWWLNDPDCVIVRQHGDLNVMTRHEMRTLATVAALTGSVLLDSDNLATIQQKHLDDLRRVLPASEQSARLRKWFAHDATQPAELELSLEDGRVILAAVHWGKRSKQTTIALPDARAYHVYDFWNKKYLGVFRRRVTIARHARHQTIVLHCAPVSSRAGVIASSRHICGADILRVTRERSMLRIDLDSYARGRGEIVVQLPAAKQIASARVSGHRARVRDLGRGVIAVPLPPQATNVEIEF